MPVNMNDVLIEKKLLILGGIPLAKEIVKRAKAMGVTVYVTDYLSDSPAKSIADKSFMVSTTDVDSVVKLIKEERIDGVLTGFVDMLLPYYQQICEKAGLPCYGTKEQFEITTNKNKFKDLCRKFNIPVVDDYKISEISNIKYPIIIKPVDNSGARGIAICNKQEDFNNKYEYALSFSPGKQVIIEQYMKNFDEASIFYVAINGEIYLTAMANRFLNDNQIGVIPLPVAYLFPFTFLEKYNDHLNNKVIDMLKHIGIKNGIIFIQSFVKNEECIFYEMGYRLTGSLEYILSDYSNGINTMDMLIRFALTGVMTEKEIYPSADFNFPCCNITFLIKPGKIGSIAGIEDIKQIPGVIALFLSKEEGFILPENAKGTLNQVILRVFASRETKIQLKETMDRIHNAFKVYDENGNDMLLKVFDTNELFRY